MLDNERLSAIRCWLALRDDAICYLCHSRESENPAFRKGLDARAGGHDALSRGHDLFKTQ
jgi:hypothetical protein